MDADASSRVQALLPKLRAGRVAYFPVRHHSPACAAHLDRLLRRLRPAAVLIEGPVSFTPMIDLLLQPDCVCPVALFSSFSGKGERPPPRRVLSFLRLFPGMDRFAHRL